VHAALSDNAFVLKRHGRISGGKYRLYGLRHDEPLLFIEETTGEFPEPSVTRACEDERQKCEILTLTDAESTGAEVDVTDAETGKRVGRIALAVDDAGDYIVGVWSITDAEGGPLGKVLARKAARPLVSAAPGAAAPQAMDIVVGGAIVGEMRQKGNVVGYELALDFRMDVANLLDRRLALATAIFAALDQGRAD
jgi:hypothetical protein